MLQTLAAAAVLICGWLYFTTILTEGEARLNQLGLTCSVVTVSMYLSPLTDLVAIIRSGDVQVLSFPLTVATFFTSTAWVLYGLELNDYYITVPNTPGIFTSLIRLYLFWKFSSTSQSSPSYKPLHIWGAVCVNKSKKDRFKLSICWRVALWNLVLSARETGTDFSDLAYEAVMV